MFRLSPIRRAFTSRAVTELFDQSLRIQRRNRAARMGAEDFLHRRALDDMIERLSMIRREFDHVLLLGCLSRATADEVRSMFTHVTLVEPASILAEQLRAIQGSDVELSIEPGTFDLVLSLGTVAESNDPLSTLLRLRLALAPGGLMLGALVGGDSLPALREAMRAADRASGKATPHVHPRIDPAGLTQMLAQAGVREPVVDVDRVEVRYSGMDRLVDDLRRMAAGNLLRDRSRRPLGKVARDEARSWFDAAASEGKTSEYFDLLHFAGWQETGDIQ